MEGWSTYTPDGRALIVRREQDVWVVKCGDDAEVQSQVLDVALIRAVRANSDVLGHSWHVDFGEWARGVADRIERDLGPGDR